MASLIDFTGPLTVDNLSWDDMVIGTGATVNSHAKVTIHYTGGLASDGTIFDSSQQTDDAQPVTFPLDMLIEGWQTGIPGMKVGGKRRLYIPYAQGYGEQGAGSVPAKADLVFDIELFGTEGGTPS